MKTELISKLKSFKDEIATLKKEVAKLTTKQVSKVKLRNNAELIATKWVEQLRSPLEYKYKIEKNVINETSDLMKTLHKLSRPNNLKSSYTRCLNSILKNYDDKFILQLQQDSGEVNDIPELRKLLSELDEPELSEYLTDAIGCAEASFYKASIVLGWCAAIDRIQKKILSIGFRDFNTASTKVKNQTSGKFKQWKKEFSITTLSELQTVFDTDLIIVLEGMELLESNQAQRLRTCFEYRNHSAHPGEAPIERAHIISFFTDLTKIIFLNENFTL